MGKLDALKNMGALRLGPPVPAGAKTIVVLGVARGGTSMVASVLERLGIFLGDQAVAPVYEDVRLATALEASDAELVRGIVDEYDAAHPVWGFKRPGAIDYLERLHASLRSPVYLVVFRDVLGIANRNVLSMKSDAFKSMRNALGQYTQLLQFLETHTPSALLLSNEKALVRPHHFVQEVASWLDLPLSEAQLKAAAAAIVVDNPLYLDSSRLHFLGNLDRATPQFVSGWACIRGKKEAARMEVRKGDRVLGTVVADRNRPDVLKNGAHPTGLCGFRYDFSAQDDVSVGTEVSVHFQLGGEPLRGSPRCLKEPEQAL